MVPLVGHLWSGDHQDSVRGQVGVDGLSLAAFGQRIFSNKLTGDHRIAVLGFLLVLAFNAKHVVGDVDLELVRAVLVSIQTHFKFCLVINQGNGEGQWG